MHMNGEINHVEDVYAVVNIFCIPSREGKFLLALSEAMVSGLPVVWIL
ncbi:glycosyltransferase [Dialister succinatiphilus]